MYAIIRNMIVHEIETCQYRQYRFALIDTVCRLILSGQMNLSTDSRKDRRTNQYLEATTIQYTLSRRKALANPYGIKNSGSCHGYEDRRENSRRIEDKNT